MVFSVTLGCCFVDLNACGLLWMVIAGFVFVVSLYVRGGSLHFMVCVSVFVVCLFVCLLLVVDFGI